KPEVGMNYLELVPEYRKGPARDLFERVRKGETIRTLSEIRGPVGSFYFELYLKPIMKDGVVTHIFRSTSDVTLKWIQEKAIREYRQNLEIIFEESADYFLLLDASGKVVLFNHKCAELTLNALGRAIMTGDLIFEVLPAIAKAQASFVFEQALNDQTGSTEVPIETSKGRVWLHIRYTPVKEQEKVVNVCLVAIDITARKMQELELNDYRLSLERKVAERTAELNLALEKEHELLDLKNKFVSMVSHEFRTPLATIGLASDFVSRYIDRLGPQEITAKLQMVGRQVKHMSAMLEDVLTIGRYEANRIQTQYTVFNLRSLLQEISEEVQGSINPTVHVDFTFAGDFEVNSDPVLMRSIFVNLVGNAVKFSGSGTVVHLSVNHSEGQVTTVVKDQGLGIPADDLNKLFQPFFRAGNVVSVVGTGLGLSIVKKAVEKLGGTIEVASEVGKGSTFKVTLPST
ncbi:MAG: PAS domain-containing sensor histidine kinase, partial [Cyclobacteriaceae bacterium]|nr:PAS domain-containing sensor histidine kinase [Cyclobacteriaceae bacterium]